MKQELTTNAKRVILHWLACKYYDIDELANLNASTPMSLEEIEKEIVRLSMTGDNTQLLARQILANGMCAECTHLKEILNNKQ